MEKDKMIRSSQTSSTGHYHYFPPLPDNPTANLISQHMHMLLITIIASAILMTIFVIAGKFLISATDSYGQLPNCGTTNINFEGWDFRMVCNMCLTGFRSDSYGKCVPV